MEGVSRVVILSPAWSGAIAANLASLCTSRVLLVLLEREIQSESDIYECARK